MEYYEVFKMKNEDKVMNLQIVSPGVRQNEKELEIRNR